MKLYAKLNFYGGNKKMKFNHKDIINLPIHPGDPLYWIDECNDFCVDSYKVDAVVIDECGIRIWQKDNGVPEDVDVEGELDNFTSKEKALAEAERLRNERKEIPEIAGEPGIWYSSSKALPRDNASVIRKSTICSLTADFVSGQGLKNNLVCGECFWMLNGKGGI